MSFATNQGGGRFYELLDALRNEYELHIQSGELAPKMSREDYESKSKRNFLLGRAVIKFFSSTIHGGNGSHAAHCQ